MLRALRGGDDGMRQRATDVLLAAVQHDAQPLRDFFTADPARRAYFQLLLRCGRTGTTACVGCRAAPGAFCWVLTAAAASALQGLQGPWNSWMSVAGAEDWPESLLSVCGLRLHV